MGIYPTQKHHRRTSFMRYVTVAELSKMIRQNLWKIPHDIDLVVGIPRSGMLPASMIALFLNTQLTDIDSFIEGKMFSNGLSRRDYIRTCTDIRKVLIVDDSISTGRALNNAKLKLEKVQNKNYEFLYIAAIASSFGASLVDACFEIVDDDRVFEWNLFHHAIITDACVDIDGVLCCNPEIDDDGEKYLSFLSSAHPLFTPSPKIDTLISCRLEKYRTITEEWMKENSISYKKLVLLDLPDKTSRIKWGKHGEYKGEYYKNSNCKIFIESSYNEATIIAKVSHKPVICIETNELLFTHMATPFKKFKRRIRKHLPKTYLLLRRIFVPSYPTNRDLK